MELFVLRCPWYVAGSIIGLLIVRLLWAINRPLGALGGYVDGCFACAATRHPPLQWRIHR